MVQHLGEVRLVLGSLSHVDDVDLEKGRRRRRNRERVSERLKERRYEQTAG